MLCLIILHIVLEELSGLFTVWSLTAWVGRA